MRNAIFAMGLARFFQDGERERDFSLPHRLARTAALLADYVSLLIVGLTLAKRLPESFWYRLEASIATPLILLTVPQEHCLTLFILLTVPLALCLLKRKLLNPWLFFPPTVLFVAAAVAAVCLTN